jgi:hypothetical protein
MMGIAQSGRPDPGVVFPGRRVRDVDTVGLDQIGARLPAPEAAFARVEEPFLGDRFGVGAGRRAAIVSASHPAWLLTGWATSAWLRSPSA